MRQSAKETQIAAVVSLNPVVYKIFRQFVKQILLYFLKSFDL